VVLLAILRLDDGAYGVAIRAEIADCTGRDVVAVQWPCYHGSVVLI
jgi:hypothetical protein